MFSNFFFCKFLPITGIGYTSMTSLFIDNVLRITYTAKYGTIDAQTEDLKTEAGLDSGLYKKGGKVSRKKSKKGKKASWNGNSEVSRWYD